MTNRVGIHTVDDAGLVAPALKITLDIGAWHLGCTRGEGQIGPYGSWHGIRVHVDNGVGIVVVVRVKDCGCIPGTTSEEEQELAEDLIILRNDDYKINIADTLYELIMVSLPMKKVHQNSDDCNSEVVEKINIEEQKNEETDPRWAALNKLKK